MRNAVVLGTLLGVLLVAGPRAAAQDAAQWPGFERGYELVRRGERLLRAPKRRTEGLRVLEEGRQALLENIRAYPDHAPSYYGLALADLARSRSREDPRSWPCYVPRSPHRGGEGGEACEEGEALRALSRGGARVRRPGVRRPGAREAGRAGPGRRRGPRRRLAGAARVAGGGPAGSRGGGPRPPPPPAPPDLLHLARCCYETGSYREAIRVLDRALASDPPYGWKYRKLRRECEEARKRRGRGR